MPALTQPLGRRTLLATAAATLAALPTSRLARAAGTHSVARREKPAPSLEILTDILQRLPGTLATADEPPVVFTFVDLEAQLKALDLPPVTPDGRGDPPSREVMDATAPLPLGSIDAFHYARTPEFTDAISFDPLAVHQVLQAGFLDSKATLFRGGFDPDRLRAAWEAAGYEPVTIATTTTGQTAWTIGPDGDHDLAHPVKRMALGAMNNVLLLDDEWLLFTRTQATLEAIAAFAAATTADSLFAAPGVSETVAMLNDETIAVTAIAGRMLTPERTFAEGIALPEALIAADAETGPLPAASLLAMAVTGGIRALQSGEDVSALGDIVVQARLAMTTPADATSAVVIVPDRWGRVPTRVAEVPYETYLSLDHAEAIGLVAAFDYTIAGPPAQAWVRLIDDRDWLPFVTTGV